MAEVKKVKGVVSKAVVKTRLEDILPVFPFNELTNSARTTFCQCRKKFFWSYIALLVPNRENKAFLIGRLFHKGLEDMYTAKGFDKDDMSAKVHKAVDEAVATCTDVSAADDLYKQSALIKGLLEGYANHYLARDLKTWKIVAPETKFCYPLSNGWTARGMRDLLVYRGSDLTLVEHKTTTILDANYIAKLPLDSQILGYALSCLKDIGKIPAKIVYNVCKKSQLRQKQTETEAQFYERIRTEYLDNPTVYFYREVLSFSKLEIMSYEEDNNQFAKEMARAIDEKYFYCNYAQCTAYGLCQYMALCQSKTLAAFKEALMSYRTKEAAHEELE